MKWLKQMDANFVEISGELEEENIVDQISHYFLLDNAQ